MTSTITPGSTATRAARSAPRPPSLVPVLAQLMIWGGAAAAVWLWWSNTAAPATASDWLPAGVRVAGPLAGYACAVLLLLMARVPLLDRSVGSDRLARWHAWGGRCTVSLVLAHVLLLLAGSTLGGGHPEGVETPGAGSGAPSLYLLVEAIIGGVLLLITAVVSARAVRRRVSYETWHFLHFATYLAVFFAFWHQVAMGEDLVGNRAANLAWYAMYITVTVLLVWSRFALPLRRALCHRLRVAEVRPEAPGVVSVYVTGHRLDELRAEAGQFFRWRFLSSGMWWAANLYSFSAAPHPEYPRITVKAAGSHSAALAHLKPGTPVLAEGPAVSAAGAEIAIPPQPPRSDDGQT
ncbi:ferric reductase [Streptomyces inhibens]|uniref:Ferric reductase n=1 Tax=Streptomyces inhibens TaxID=2293571 RepID=A0A371PXE7_STRIH|nr:ferric reductase-like transmembrane domain-containing protein [Streptomyces inhibens]REK86961.1 ferric reductase [Streptomyces inhibens]